MNRTTMNDTTNRTPMTHALLNGRSALAAALSLFACAAARAGDNTHTFNFANVGQSYSAAIFGGNPLAGRRVISTTIVLNLSVDPGSNALEFMTDILLPIDTDDPAGSVVAYSGETLEWSGSGTFAFTETTTRYNGTIIPIRFGAETFGVAGELLEGSGIFVTLEPLPCAADLDNDGDFGNGGSPDGAVTIDDLLFFLAAFEAGDASVDLDDGSGTGTPDEAVTVDDLLYFLARFEGGC